MHGRSRGQDEGNASIYTAPEHDPYETSNSSSDRRRSATPTAASSSPWTTSKRPRAGPRSRSMSSSRSTSARPECRRSTRTATRRSSESGEPGHRTRARRPPGLRPTRRLLDPLGQRARLLRHATRTPRPSTTSCATCSPPRWRRPTRRSGSTPVCTGPTASPARPRATGTPIPKTGKLKTSSSAYEHPQPHACFIQSVSDDLVNDGGIMDLWVREARLFKYGSGTGTNFSQLRGDGEPLSGGGRSSGLMSFLKIGDRAAGAIKSGGTTRRAAKMVCLDLDHPDIEEFISWKAVEERKVAALVAGSRTPPAPPAGDPRRVLSRRSAKPGHGPRQRTPTSRDRDPHRAPARACPTARSSACSSSPPRASGATRSRSTTPTGTRTPTTPCRARTPTTASASPTPSSTPSRSTGDWTLINRTDGEVAQEGPGRQALERHHPRRLGVRRPGSPVRRHHQRVAHLPGERPDQRLQPLLRVHVPRRHRLQPGLLNLVKFLGEDGNFDIETFRHAVRLWTMVLEISVLMASFPIAPHRRAQLPLPHPRPRLRQHRFAADAAGHPLRLGQGPLHLRRHHRHHDRRVLRHLGRDGRRARPLRRASRTTASTCCGSSATTAAPPTTHRPRCTTA